MGLYPRCCSGEPLYIFVYLLEEVRQVFDFLFWASL